MKINLQAIKNESSVQSYLKGVKLFEAGKVYQIRDDENVSENSFNISADVEGSYENDYHVYLEYDLNDGKILEYDCECPAFYNYEGMCKHCVATALSAAEDLRTPSQIHLENFLNRKKTPIRKIVTDPRLSGLIYSYSMEDKAKFLQPKVTGSIELEPTLRISYDGWGIDFRIGGKDKYVLKDLHSFLEAFEMKRKVDYGKKLGFIHERTAFTNRAIRMIEFLKKYVEEYCYYKREDYRFSYYYKASMRILKLSDDAKGEFLHLLEGNMCKLEDAFSGDKFLHLLEGNPEIEIGLEKLEGKDGYQIILPPMETFRSDHRLYIRQGGNVYACDETFSSSMYEICKLGENNHETVLEVSKEDMVSFCTSLLPILEKNVRFRTEEVLEEYLPQEVEIKIYLDMADGYISAKLNAEYGENIYNIVEGFQVGDAFRDVQKESAVSYVAQQYFHGLTLDNKLWISEEDEDEIYKLLTTGVDQLSQYGELYISESFKQLTLKKPPKIVVGISVKGDLLDLKIEVEELSTKDLEGLLEGYHKRKKFFRLKNGDFMELKDNSVAMISELIEGLGIKESELAKDSITIPAYRAFYLDKTLKSEVKSVEVFRDKMFKSMIRTMSSIEDSDFELPQSLKTIMRNYQKVGFRWLCTLETMKFGGILADDMGLGKTLQVISFLLYHKELEKKVSLIVCPASLVYNWQNEVEKFAPELSILVLAGNAEERMCQIENYQNYDVVVTSYDLLKRDIECYSNKSFYAEIIDEAQNIKNHSTQAAKAVKGVNATVKFALTGTPIENRLSELWSIFDYLMPGFLGSYSSFRKDYETPIAVNRDEAITKRLQRMIKPFILRRVKSDVLKELAEKEENVVYTKLEGEQLTLYSAHVQRVLNSLSKKSKEEFSTGKLQILAELTKLRQLCCAPAMLYENYKGESAKIDTCMELLRNAVEGGHKVLVFSQFTSLFTLLEKELKREKMEYYKLTGATSKIKRMEMVDEFNANEIPVFLISLKAGGTGLNLTGASIVIHFDPWWNVAAQNQATDRAHRIGQKNLVSVFKLIAKNTIEEKILKMQEAKKDLSEQIISGEGISVSNLSKEDFMKILE